MNAPASAAAMPPQPAPRTVQRTRAVAVGSLLALIALGLAWELMLAPLRPEGSWLAVKVLPLILALAGLMKNRLYTYRWMSLLVWLYFTEGVVRAASDANACSRALAGFEVALSLALFVACVVHVRLRLRGAWAGSGPSGRAAQPPSGPAADTPSSPLPAHRRRLSE